MEENFGIAFGLKSVADVPELFPQLTVVVDLPVEDQVERPKVHGLVRALVEVDNREPAEGKAHNVVLPDALPVRPALCHCKSHALEQVVILVSTSRSPSYAAHNRGEHSVAPSSSVSECAALP